MTVLVSSLHFGKKEAETKGREDDTPAATLPPSRNTPAAIGRLSTASSLAYEASKTVEIGDRLGRAYLIGKRRELRIRVICFLLGTLMYVCGAPAGWLCFFKILRGDICSVGAGAYWSLGICFAVWLLPFAPTHLKWMPRTILFICCFFVCIFIALVIASIEFRLTNCSLHGFSGTACRFWSSWPAVALIPQAASLGTLAYAVRWNRNGYVMSGRQMLATFWIGIRIFYFGGGLVILVPISVIAALDDRFASSHAFRGYVACCFVWISTGYLLKSSHRRKLVLLMGQIGKESGLEAAATIASAIGAFGLKSTLDMSKQSFRGLSLASLDADDIANRDDCGLYAKTTHAKLGSVDAFISHSWSDPCTLKWQALQYWRRSFVLRNGREPIVWLDKACINQQNIQRSLACLPVFLASCKSLVVIAGPTYTERLWCCMELFTFLRMGGSPENINIFSIGAVAKLHTSTL